MRSQFLSYIESHHAVQLHYAKRNDKISEFYILIILSYETNTVNQHMTFVKKAAKEWLLTLLNFDLRLSLPVASWSESQSLSYALEVW